MKNNICIIGVYFGKLPSYFDLWVLSVKYNRNIDFIIVTDQEINYNIPNLKIISSNLKNFKELAEKKLKLKIKLETPYKLCDFKEVYGIILEDEIKEYQYWGECDFDVIFGDLNYFFEKYKIEQYDKFLNRGHLTLYRNTPQVNNNYKLNGGKFGTYKEVFKSNLNWAFDETMGINMIYKKHNIPFMDEFIYVDVDVNYNDIRMVERPGNLCKNNEYQIFYWDKGKLFRDFIDNKGNLLTYEYAYIHLQHRKIPKPEFDVNKKELSYYITNNGFIEKKQDTDLTIIEKYNPKDKIVPKELQNGEYKKDLKFFWIGRRYLNFKYELIRTLSKIKNKIFTKKGVKV